MGGESTAALKGLSIRLVNTRHVSEKDIERAFANAIASESIENLLTGTSLQLTVEEDLSGSTATVRALVDGAEYLARASNAELVEALELAATRLASKLRSAARKSPRDAGIEEFRLAKLEDAAATVGASELEHFETLVGLHLDSLTQYVRRELDYLRGSGLLRPDSPSATQIIDETLSEALEDLPFRTEVTPASSWLAALATRVMEREVATARLRDREGLNHLSIARLRRLHEQSDPPPVSGESNDEQDEGVSTEVTSAEIREHLLELLADLPGEWRRVVLLAHVEGQAHEVIAASLSVSPEEVRERLVHAEAYLRARLAEDGLPASSLESIGACLGERHAPDPLAQRVKDDFVRALGTNEPASH